MWRRAPPSFHGWPIPLYVTSSAAKRLISHGPSRLFHLIVYRYLEREISLCSVTGNCCCDCWADFENYKLLFSGIYFCGSGLISNLTSRNTVAYTLAVPALQVVPVYVFVTVLCCNSVSRPLHTHTHTHTHTHKHTLTLITLPFLCPGQVAPDADGSRPAVWGSHPASPHVPHAAPQTVRVGRGQAATTAAASLQHLPARPLSERRLPPPASPLLSPRWLISHVKGTGRVLSGGGGGKKRRKDWKFWKEGEEEELGILKGVKWGGEDGGGRRGEGGGWGLDSDNCLKNWTIILSCRHLWFFISIYHLWTGSSQAGQRSCEAEGEECGEVFSKRSCTDAYFGNWTITSRTTLPFWFSVRTIDNKADLNQIISARWILLILAHLKRSSVLGGGGRGGGG